MSRAQDPPTYEAAMAQLNQLQQQGVSDAGKKAAEIAATNKLADEPQNLVDEIRALGDSAVQIDKGFQDVYVALGEVDNSGYVDGSGNPLPKLQPTWKGFKDRYTKLLWDSRTTATVTEAYLLDFNEVVLPMINDAIDDPNNTGKFNDAIAELNVFIDRNNPYKGIVDGGDAYSHSQAFTDLRRDLEEFKDKFDDFSKKQQGGINTQIEKIKGDIAVLNLEIKKCDDIVMAMGIALGITVFASAAGAVAALACLGPLGPVVAIGCLIVGAMAAIAELSTLIAYIVKGNGKCYPEFKAELRQKEAELKGLQDKLKLLQSIQASLEAQKSTIGDIAARLDRFAAIWSQIAHDAVLLREQFKNAGQSGSLGGLKYRVQSLMKTYTPLKDGLKIYATMIDQSGVPKP